MILYGLARRWWSSDDDTPRRFAPNGSLARERYAPGAFSACLASNREIKLLWQHDKSRELASTSDGSLSIWEDHLGLAFCATPRGSFVEAAIHEVRMGRCRKMSIGIRSFEDFDYERLSGELVRTVMECHIHEISLVQRPACYETSVAAAERLPVEILRRRIDSLETSFAGRPLIG
jgi:HK97 family phage prohead protease